jgi:hypothetical protein
VSGTWTAVYGDTTYIRRRVRERPGSAISIGHSIHIDEEGNVDSATPAPEALTRMLDAHWIGEVLSFAINGGDEIERFEFRLIDVDHAEVMPIMSEEQRQELADEPMPLSKPFPLTRTHYETVTHVYGMTVTDVSGINCYPCDRNGPETNGSSGWIRSR